MYFTQNKQISFCNEIKRPNSLLLCYMLVKIPQVNYYHQRLEPYLKKKKKAMYFSQNNHKCKFLYRIKLNNTLQKLYPFQPLNYRVVKSMLLF